MFSPWIPVVPAKRYSYAAYCHHVLLHTYVHMYKFILQIGGFFQSVNYPYHLLTTRSLYTASLRPPGSLLNREIMPHLAFMSIECCPTQSCSAPALLQSHHGLEFPCFGLAPPIVALHAILRKSAMWMPSLTCRYACGNFLQTTYMRLKKKKKKKKLGHHIKQQAPIKIEVAMHEKKAIKDLHVANLRNRPSFSLVVLCYTKPLELFLPHSMAWLGSMQKVLPKALCFNQPRAASAHIDDCSCLLLQMKVPGAYITINWTLSLSLGSILLMLPDAFPSNKNSMQIY